MAKWRYYEKLGADTIAERLNLNLEKHPPPEPPGGLRTRGAWSKSSVAEILKNPKYTGYQVYNRRARRSRGGRNKPNPPEMWVWSPEPAHEPLIPKWMFDEINAQSSERQGSRDGAGLKDDRRAKRTYLFRRRVVCDCGRRMIGNPRHGRTYYRCHPENNNRGRPDKYEGHPATIYMREDLIVSAVNEFFAQRVFGNARREMFVAGLDQAGDDDRHERDEERQRLRRKVADATRKQDNVLRQAEDADPNDPFAQGLRNRYNELEAERQAALSAISELDSQESKQPVRPSLDAVDLLDALPQLAVNLHRAPEDLLNKLFDLTQLTIRVHCKTGEATLTVTLPQDHISEVAETASEMEQEVPTGCDKIAGQSLCASCTCPRADTYSIHTKPAIR
jgi:site-specific DNA recombinase